MSTINDIHITLDGLPVDLVHHFCNQNVFREEDLNVLIWVVQLTKLRRKEFFIHQNNSN